MEINKKPKNRIMKKLNFYATEKMIISKESKEEFVLIIEAVNYREASIIASRISEETKKSVYAIRRAEIMDLTGYGKIVVARKGFVYKTLFSMFDKDKWRVANANDIEIGRTY